MIDLHGIGDLRSASAAEAEHGTRIREAAREFEALLLAQMLRHVRESGSGGWTGGEADQGAGSMIALAEEQLARVLASGGGMGLADLIGDQVREDRPGEHGASPSR